MYFATHKRNLKLFFQFLQGRNKSRKYTCLRFCTPTLRFLGNFSVFCKEGITSFLLYFWGFWESSQFFAKAVETYVNLMSSFSLHISPKIFLPTDNRKMCLIDTIRWISWIAAKVIGNLTRFYLRDSRMNIREEERDRIGALICSKLSSFIEIRVIQRKFLYAYILILSDI